MKLLPPQPTEEMIISIINDVNGAFGTPTAKTIYYNLYEAAPTIEQEPRAWSYSQRMGSGNIGQHITSFPPSQKYIDTGNIFEVEPLYATAPDQSKRIAELEAKLAECNVVLASLKYTAEDIMKTPHSGNISASYVKKVTEDTLEKVKAK